jgi:hypothetical protein
VTELKRLPRHLVVGLAKTTKTLPVGIVNWLEQLMPACCYRLRARALCWSSRRSMLSPFVVMSFQAGLLF